MTESPADQAERMVPVAAALVGAVHDGGPGEVAALLAGIPAHDRDALAVVLAAMVNPDRTVTELLAWVTWDENGRPLPHSPDTSDWLTEAHRNRSLLDRLARWNGRTVLHNG